MAENIDYSSGNERSGNDEHFGLPEVTMTPIDREDSARKTSHSRKSSSKKSGSDAQTNVGLIFALILIFLVATSGVLYFFWDDIFSGKNDLNTTPDSEISNVITDPQDENLNETEDSLNDDVATDEPDNTEGSGDVSNDLSETGVGQIIDVSSRTQRTYVVIGSFIDEDLARDYGNRLARQGVSTKLIMPYNNKRFYRLSIADFDTISEAINNLDDLKSTYGDQAWVLKY